MLLEPLTKSDNYKKFFEKYGKVPSMHTTNCFATGLPGVWLYLKALGVEEVYFDTLEKAKQNSEWFKELVYLLQKTNSNNKFFPKIAKDLILDKVPAYIKEAELELDKPDFEMVYDFNADQLKECLSHIATDKKQVRIGNNSKSIAIMCEGSQYKVYHNDNPSPLSCKSLDNCVATVMRLFANG